MRIRRLITVSFGAAVGAGAMYLLDPEHGPARRREARTRALAQARTSGTQALRDAGQHAQTLALAAVEGFQQGRSSGAPEHVDGGQRR